MRLSATTMAWVLLAPAAMAQFSVPASKPSPETLFRNQCGTCHTLSAADGPRQGPPLGA